MGHNKGVFNNNTNALVLLCDNIGNAINNCLSPGEGGVVAVLRIIDKTATDKKIEYPPQEAIDNKLYTCFIWTCRQCQTLAK